MFDVCIIGCGVIGAATAFELSKYKADVLILEKENDVSMGASRANSAIIHAGYDPKPGTLMARLNVEGNAMAEQLCRDLSVPFSRIGSLVLAFTEEEEKTVQMLYERGVANGVPGLRIINADEVREMEPQVSTEVRSALYAPSAGIITPWEYTLAFAETAVRNGVALKLNSRVEKIEKLPGGGYRMTTPTGVYEARYVINAAGVHSGEVHEMVAEKTFTVMPNRGEYYVMDKAECFRANHVLFQCPNQDGKGVLVTPTMDHNLLVGPNAVGVEDGDRVNNTAEGMAFVREKAGKSVPGINYRNAIRNFAGIRANTDKDEFQIGIAAENFIDLAGIKSPGLSSAPAIARALCAQISEEQALTPSPETVPYRKPAVPFREMTPEEQEKALRENPLYGNVICRCEVVTEAEIVQAIHRPVPALHIDAVKRRTRAGMGRCQGGFCSPRVASIISRETGIPLLEITKNGGSSYLLTGTLSERAERKDRT